MQVTHDASSPPALPVPGIRDHATAISVYAGIVSGLYRRERSGKGCNVRTSLIANGVWGDIDNATDDVAAVLNRLGGAHIPTIPKAKRFADRQAQSLIVSSLLLIDLSSRRLLSRSLIAS
jgi:crotonobetainyl-CoA:carnitine CoA-transferase CaiB-like acyl-CoA transferase